MFPDLPLVRGAVLKLLTVFMLTGCTYGPPVYQGELDSARLMGDGRVAVGYSQKVTRYPTGLSTWPDGGRAITLHNQVLVALVDPDGRTREIARYDHDSVLGKGFINVRWHEADPGHLYVTRSGQLSTGPSARGLSETHRIDLNGREIARFDLSRELAAEGLDFGAKGAGLYVVDARGTMLVGATRDGVRELWRRDSDGRWMFLDQFDSDVRHVGDEIVYQLGDDLFARNWLTGDVRKVMRFNRSTQRSEVLIPGHPAILHDKVYQPTITASVIRIGNDISISRDGDRIAMIKPDDRVLDRR